jgi:uncharacterized protein (TIGR03083 family)
MAEYSTRDALLAALAAERAALEAVLARYDEATWRGKLRADGWNAHDIAAHLADANYGLALMVLGEVKPSMPLNDKGWMDVDDYNQQRREKNAALPMAKVAARLASSFEHAQRAIEASDDLGAPGPYGPVHTKSLWLNRIVAHTHMHRVDLEELLG